MLNNKEVAITLSCDIIFVYFRAVISVVATESLGITDGIMNRALIHIW